MWGICLHFCGFLYKLSKVALKRLPGEEEIVMVLGDDREAFPMAGSAGWLGLLEISIG